MSTHAHYYITYFLLSLKDTKIKTSLQVHKKISWTLDPVPTGFMDPWALHIAHFEMGQPHPLLCDFFINRVHFDGSFRSISRN